MRKSETRLYALIIHSYIVFEAVYDTTPPPPPPTPTPNPGIFDFQSNKNGLNDPKGNKKYIEATTAIEIIEHFAWRFIFHTHSKMENRSDI